MTELLSKFLLDRFKKAVTCGLTFLPTQELLPITRAQLHLSHRHIFFRGTGGRNFLDPRGCDRMLESDKSPTAFAATSNEHGAFYEFIRQRRAGAYERR